MNCAKCSTSAVILKFLLHSKKNSALNHLQFVLHSKQYRAVYLRFLLHYKLYSAVIFCNWPECITVQIYSILYWTIWNWTTVELDAAQNEMLRQFPETETISFIETRSTLYPYQAYWKLFHTFLVSLSHLLTRSVNSLVQHPDWQHFTNSIQKLISSLPHDTLVVVFHTPCGSISHTVVLLQDWICLLLPTLLPWPFLLITSTVKFTLSFTLF